MITKEWIQERAADIMKNTDTPGQATAVCVYVLSVIVTALPRHEQPQCFNHILRALEICIRGMADDSA